MNKKELPDFTSFLSNRELGAVLLYIPLHTVVLPMICNRLIAGGMLSDSVGNFILYAIGFAYMLVFAFSFLRRDFDPLCDRPLHCLFEILTGYITMICLNFCVSYIIVAVIPNSENPNNAAVMSLVFKDYGIMKATVVFLAPLLEELLFRAGIFGGLYDRNRKAAYAVSALCFALYHVWDFALADPIYWVYLLEYIPVSLLLARCYERTNSIWCSVFFHMMVNSVSVNALEMLQELI